MLTLPSVFEGAQDIGVPMHVAVNTLKAWIPVETLGSIDLDDGVTGKLALATLEIQRLDGVTKVD